MKRLIVAISITLIPCICLAAPQKLKGSVYSPYNGTICDKKSGFCADDHGISMALTKLYLGEKAEKKMMDMIKDAGENNFDSTVYVLSNGVSCDSKAKKCMISKYDKKIDFAHTKALFGADAAAPTNHGAVYSPDKGILCDKKIGFCADSQGISMAFTKEYLGAKAENKQMQLMKQGKLNPNFFVLSDGSACNINDKKCYVGEFDSNVHTANTRALFGN